MGGGRGDGRGRRGEGGEERGRKERDGRRGRGAVTWRREGNWEGAEQGPDPAPGTGAGKSRGGGGRAGAGGAAAGPRGERGRGLGGQRGGGSGYRAEGGGGEGRGRGAAAAKLASSAGRLWRRRRPCGGGGGGGRTHRRPGARGPTALFPELLAGPETTAADDAQPQAPGGRALPGGLTAAGRHPWTRRGSPRRAEVSARRRPALSAAVARPGRPLRGGGGGGAAGGFVLSRRQWGRGGLGLRDEGERERVRGGRAWGVFVCVCPRVRVCVGGRAPGARGAGRVCVRAWAV